jgi:hypothetical protein
MGEPHKRGGLRSRHLRIAATHDAVHLTFELDFPVTLGLVARAREARRRVKACLRTLGISARATGTGGLTARVSGADLADTRRAIEEVDAVLDAFAKGGLTPRMVEHVLGISSRERIRWTKDGRLPKSGSASFRRGPNVIHFPLHPAHKIARLAADPSIVAAWRDADGEDANTDRAGVL